MSRIYDLDRAVTFAAKVAYLHSDAHIKRDYTEEAFVEEVLVYWRREAEAALRKGEDLRHAILRQAAMQLWRTGKGIPGVSRNRSIVLQARYFKRAFRITKAGATP